jgi:hypothetical protein
MVLDQTLEVECLVSVTLILNFPLERSRAYNMEKDVLMFTKVAEFSPHKVYYHGCLKDFVEITQWNGAEVHFSPVLYTRSLTAFNAYSYNKLPNWGWRSTKSNVLSAN